MTLLFVTQVVDQDDPRLGFVHEWAAELANQFARVEVVCLYEGMHQLPGNVAVHSLGKESLPRFLLPVRRLLYAFRFLVRAVALRHRYDAVFVHMNQEYVLLGGPLWRMLRKPVFLWRNHYAGSVLTDLAAFFCRRVYCTSRFSYTAKYPKTVLMPVGVDTGRFRPDSRVPRKPHSILFLARMAPSKNPLLLLEALRHLKDESVQFTATFAGSPLPEHEAYYRSLTGRAEHYGLSEQVAFMRAVSKNESPDLYRAHQLFVNTSPSGMLDKTMFEAAACGATVVASSADLADRLPHACSFKEGDLRSLAGALKEAFATPERSDAELVAKRESLPALARALAASITEAAVVPYTPVQSGDTLTNAYAKQYYDHQVGALSGSYTDDRWHSSPVREFEYQQTRRALEAALGDRPYRNALEIGPGDGVWTGLIRSHVEGPMHLVEQSEAMLAKARERLPDGVTFERADFLESNPPGTYDLIVAVRCFEYFDDKPTALRKMRNLLAEGGKLVIVTKNPRLLTGAPAQGKTLHSGQVDPATMTDLAEVAALRVSRVYPAVLRWKAQLRPMRALFDVLQRIAVRTRGRLTPPLFGTYATESYVYEIYAS